MMLNSERFPSDSDGVAFFNHNHPNAVLIHAVGLGKVWRGQAARQLALDDTATRLDTVSCIEFTGTNVVRLEDNTSFIRRHGKWRWQRVPANSVVDYVVDLR